MKIKRVALWFAGALLVCPLSGAGQNPASAKAVTFASLGDFFKPGTVLQDRNGDGVIDFVDVRLSKFFQISGSRRVEFIAQLFNVFNRANFNVAQSSITLGNDPTGRPLFGQPNSLAPNINAPSRQAEFAVRFQF